jgi:hypothetical protein
MKTSIKYIGPSWNHSLMRDKHVAPLDLSTHNKRPLEVCELLSRDTGMDIYYFSLGYQETPFILRIFRFAMTFKRLVHTIFI